MIDIPETDKRRMLDALTYRMNQDGGALGHVPVEGGRVIFAAVGHPRHMRVTPTLQRLVREAESFHDRERLPTDPIGWFTIISLEEQLERRIFDTLMRRTWRVGDKVAKVGYRQGRPVPDNGTRIVGRNRC